MASGKSSNQDNHEEEFKSNYKESNQVNLNLIPYWFLAALRVILTLLPQTGYIHPDEYFQSLEILNNDIFDVATTRVWEFNSTFPLRNIVLPYAVMGLPLSLLKNVSPFLNLWFDIKAVTPYTLILVPRLACCILSFVTDFCIYRICYIYGQNYRARLLTLASSYVMLVYSTRTFTNSLEMALSSFLTYLVAGCMAKSDQIIYQDEYLREKYNQADNIKERVKLHRLRLSLPWHTFSHVFYIATVTVIGIFNRPTFFAFAFPPLFFWLLRGMGTRFIGLTHFNLRVFALIICAIPSLFIMILIDSFYYGRITVQDITNRNMSIWTHLVLTPCNFIIYNIDPKNLKEHGLHFRLTHFLINIPLLYNVLGISGIYGFLHLFYRGIQGRWSSLPRIQSIIGLMTSNFILPVALLSIFPHQEPRFLIPVTLPLVFLHSQRIRHIKEKNSFVTKKENGYTAFLKAKVKPDGRDSLLATWYLLNIIFTILFGFIHQAGVYPLMSHLSKELEVKPRMTTVHLVTSHTYTLPISLLQLKYGPSATVHFDNSSWRYQRSRDVYTYELGSESMETVAGKLSELLEKSEKKWKEKRLKYRLYYAYPGTLSYDFMLACLSYNLTAKVETVFYPHLSTEALPHADFSNILSQLGLVLTRITAV